MPDIEPLGGLQWMPLDIPPDIPEGLPQLQGLTTAPLRWYSAEADDLERLYAAVGGDCGPEGPYLIAVYCLTSSIVDPFHPGARYPSFDEWTSLAAHACLPGVVLACSFIVGAALIEPAEGRALMLTQSAVLGNTAAALRWGLANPGAILHPGGVA